jgi:hypothetical protein
MYCRLSECEQCNSFTFGMSNSNFAKIQIIHVQKGKVSKKLFAHVLTNGIYFESNIADDISYAMNTLSILKYNGFS